MEEDDVPMEVEAAKEADEELSEEFQLLAAQAVTAPEQAMAGYLAIINGPLEKTPAGLKRHTFAIQQLGALYAKHGKAQELGNLIYTVRPFLEFVSKAKGGQLFKSLMDLFLDIPNVQQLQVEVCNNCLEWAKTEKRTFLRQSLEVRLLALYLEAKQYQNCLAQAATLLKELKRLDDKALLVDVHLLESKSFFALGNYPRSRASLVSARTTANAIYCPPRMQASLDLQSGVLHAQEGDFKTAYSYFYEAFEGFDSVDVKVQAILGLKYMLLGKIVNDEARDVQSICSGKLALRYAGRDLEAMKKVSEASIHRSLAEFEECLVNYKQELKQDPIIATHLTRLYDELLEKNLARVVEPFSKVEIDHVAKVIQRPREIVEAKLSQMILDKKLDGILDQGAGCLELFTVSESDRTYEAALGTIQQMGGVVDALFARAQKIF